MTHTNRYTGMLDLHLSDMLKTYRALLDSIEEQASPKERQRYALIFEEFDTIRRRVQ